MYKGSKVFFLINIKQAKVFLSPHIFPYRLFLELSLRLCVFASSSPRRRVTTNKNLVLFFFFFFFLESLFGISWSFDYHEGLRLHVAFRTAHALSAPTLAPSHVLLTRRPLPAGEGLPARRLRPLRR